MKTITTVSAFRSVGVPALLLVDTGTWFQGRAVSSGAPDPRRATPSVGLDNRARVGLGATPILHGTSLT